MPRSLNYSLRCLILVGLVLFSTHVWAGAVDSGYYTVRYSAINSLQIPAAVAQTNGIERDGNKAVVTITLQYPTEDNPYQAVPAKVTGKARTLLGMAQTLDFRRVQSSGSVYSIAVLPLTDKKQTVTLSLEVSTVDGSTLIPVTFTKRLYIRKP